MSAMRIVVSLLVLTISGCGGSEDSAHPPMNFLSDPPLWNEYKIGFGETINLAEDVSLEFTGVAEDSRCPTGAQCVVAGNARIIVKTLTPRGITSVQLNTDPNLPDSALFDYYGVELRSLTPYPVIDPQTGAATIPNDAYEATLFVVKAATPP
jgi:hypothetical protein